MTPPATKKRRSSGPSGPSTPHAGRTHRMIQVTLAPETRERLDAMQAADGVPRSRLLAALIEAEWARRAADRDATTTITIHEIAVDGLPPSDGMTGRVAFIFDGCIVSGWPLDDGTWEANSDVGRAGRFAGVTHWVEFQVPVWDILIKKPAPQK